MSKHTPGPWRVHPDGQGCDRVVGPRGIIADTIGIEANARLIAAAPELLAALVDLAQRADTTELRDGSSLDTLRAHALLAQLEGAPYAD